MTLQLEDIDQFEGRPDFRRANGAPMVIIDGRNERFSRPSSYGKCLDDESALTNWRINRAILGVALHRDIAARAAAAKEEDSSAWSKLRDDAIAGGRGAESADLGTALHAMSERWEDPNDDFDPPEVYRASLEAYTAEMTRLGLETAHFEFHTVNLDYRAAGTCDRLYRLTKPLKTPKGVVLPAGTLVIGDLKTGKRLDYSLPGYAIQLALYAQGQFYDPVDDVFLETPPINDNWAVLVHMPVEAGTCQFIWVDLDEGNYGAWLALEVKRWRQSWRSGRIPAPSIPDPIVGSPLARIRAELGAMEIDMIAWIRERLSGVSRNPDAKTALLRQWPEGVPTPRQGLCEAEHIQQVHELLTSIERSFELAFVPAPTHTGTQETQDD